MSVLIQYTDRTANNIEHPACFHNHNFYKSSKLPPCFLFKFFAFLYRIAKIAEPTKNSVEIPNIIPADFAFELLLQLLEDISI